MTEATWLMVVEATVDVAVEEEWNRWYDEVHLPEIVSCPDFEGGARYVADGDRGRRYLTLYRLRRPEVPSSDEFARRRGWGPYQDAVDATVTVFRPVHPQAPGESEKAP